LTIKYEKTPLLPELEIKKIKYGTKTVDELIVTLSGSGLIKGHNAQLRQYRTTDKKVFNTLSRFGRTHITSLCLNSNLFLQNHLPPYFL